MQTLPNLLRHKVLVSMAILLFYDHVRCSSVSRQDKPNPVFKWVSGLPNVSCKKRVLFFAVIFYYMASPVSRQDEPNCTLWLATFGAGKMAISCPLRTTCRVLWEKFPQKPFMSRIECKYCLISTSHLAGLFDIFTWLHIWQNCVCFVDFLPMRTLCDAYHSEFESH